MVVRGRDLSLQFPHRAECRPKADHGRPRGAAPTIDSMVSYPRPCVSIRLAGKNGVGGVGVAYMRPVNLYSPFLGLWTRFGRGIAAGRGFVRLLGSHVCDPYKSESNSLPGRGRPIGLLNRVGLNGHADFGSDVGLPRFAGVGNVSVHQRAFSSFEATMR